MDIAIVVSCCWWAHLILDHFHDCSLAGKERDQHTGHSRRRGKIGWLRNFRRFGIILLAPKLVGFPPLIMLPLSTVFSILRSIYMLSLPVVLGLGYLPLLPCSHVFFDFQRFLISLVACCSSFLGPNIQVVPQRCQRC